MALFEQHHYGKPISKLLSDYLRKYATMLDQASAAVHGGVSASTVREVVLMNTPITQVNSKAIIGLMRIAIQNCMVEAKEARDAKRYFERNLKAS